MAEVLVRDMAHNIERRIRFPKQVTLMKAAYDLRNPTVFIVHETVYNEDKSESDVYYLELTEEQFKQLNCDCED